MTTKRPSPLRLTPPELDLWRAMIRVSQLLPAALEAALVEEGESLARYEIMAVLATLAEGVRPTELGRYALVSKPRLSVHVASLEADGYVARADHPEDARASLITLTSAGRRRLAALTPKHLGLARRLTLDCIAPEDRAAVLRSLAAMLAALDDTWAPGRLP
jgi:DNA-binding MarR family transcriptional regulator